VFYAAEAIETAIAEGAFYALLFYVESPDTPFPVNPFEYTAFAAEIAAVRVADLTRAPFVADRVSWTHLTDYTACLDLADMARAVELEAIRYESVRDPYRRANLAILTCRGFAEYDAVERQTWHFHLSSSGVRAACEAPRGNDFL
jgi:RES domain-containing protein